MGKCHHYHHGGEKGIGKLDLLAGDRCHFDLSLY